MPLFSRSTCGASTFSGAKNADTPPLAGFFGSLMDSGEICGIAIIT